VAVCPPVVEYSRESQARAAEELAPLPKEFVVAEMLSDYAVMREQALACPSYDRYRSGVEHHFMSVQLARGAIDQGAEDQKPRMGHSSGINAPGPWAALRP